MNSAPEAQPVWYAAQANDRASNQTETQRALPDTRGFLQLRAHTVSTWATWQRRDERQGNVEAEGMEELQEMKGEAGKQKEDRNIWNPIPIWSTRPQKWGWAPPVNTWSQISNTISQMGLRSSVTSVQMLANLLIKNVSWKCQRRLKTLQANSGELGLLHQYGVAAAWPLRFNNKALIKKLSRLFARFRLFQ